MRGVQQDHWNRLEGNDCGHIYLFIDYNYNSCTLVLVLSARYLIHVYYFHFKDLSYKEKHWHEACFLCNKCRVSLVDKQFGSKADKIYCGNCYDTQFASRCDGCGEIFRAGKCLAKKKFN